MWWWGNLHGACHLRWSTKTSQLEDFAAYRNRLLFAFFHLGRFDLQTKRTGVLAIEGGVDSELDAAVTAVRKHLRPRPTLGDQQVRIEYA